MNGYGVRRFGCGGVLARGVLILMLGIVALICIANRSWFQAKAVNAIHGHRPQIHQGQYFEPGASAVEDGVRQTAVMIDGDPHVRVISPTREWRRNHEDAKCKQNTCTAAATPGRFVGAGGLGIGALAAALLLGYLVWTLLMGDSNRGDRRAGDDSR